jgi:neutral ceramidase
MNGTNTLLSGDNKGYASYVMERQHHDGSMQAPFVAAFASTNLGDVSPNTAGPRCLDTGAPCDVLHSTCGGRNELCVASGPGSNMQESTEIIGRRQYEVAQALLENAMNGDRLLQGPVAFRHAFVDMAHRNVTVDNVTVHTCPAALGYGFAAGTTDGPGMFDFSQGQNSTNPFWNIVSRFLSVPSQAQIDCHHPKPILLNTGEATLPYAWDPQSVPISIFRIGNFYLLNVPAELTTMAGRRLRRAVEAVIVQHRPKEERPQVTIAGLANSYTHYVTTQEEYAGQRYEAASTLYGPHTLAAYIQEFERLTRDLLLDRPSRSDDPPDDLLKHQLSLIPPAMADTIGIGKKFGSVARDVEQDVYDKGDTVHVSFRSANPRHNPRIGGTFLTVDRWMDDDSWQTMYVDGDWCTKYVWNSPQLELGISFAEMYWDIPDEAPAGQYRMCHYGTRKTWVGAYLEGWSLQYVPDWAYMDNLLGSMAAGWLWRLLRFLATVVEPVGDTIQQILEMGRLKDFEGCSKTFQVR